MALTTIEKALQDFVCLASGLDDAHVIFEDGKPRPEGTYISLNVDTESAPADDDDATEHNPLVLAPDVIEAVIGNAFTLTAHAYVNADGGVRFTTTNTLPTPLAIATDYWLIVDGVNTVRVATSRSNARAGVAIALLDGGIGVHTIVTTAASRRVGQEIKLVKRGPRRCEMQVQCFSTAPTGSGSARAVLKKLVDRSELPASIALLDAAGIGGIGFDSVQMTPEIVNRDVFQGRAFTSFSFFIVASEHELGTTIEQAEITNPRGRTYIVRRV